MEEKNNPNRESLNNVVSDNFDVNKFVNENTTSEILFLFKNRITVLNLNKIAETLVANLRVERDLIVLGLLIRNGVKVEILGSGSKSDGKIKEIAKTMLNPKGITDINLGNKVAILLDEPNLVKDINKLDLREIVRDYSDKILDLYLQNNKVDNRDLEFLSLRYLNFYAYRKIKFSYISKVYLSLLCKKFPVLREYIIKEVNLKDKNCIDIFLDSDGKTYPPQFLETLVEKKTTHKEELWNQRTFLKRLGYDVSEGKDLNCINEIGCIKDLNYDSKNKDNLTKLLSHNNKKWNKDNALTLVELPLFIKESLNKLKEDVLDNILYNHVFELLSEDISFLSKL